MLSVSNDAIRLETKSKLDSFSLSLSSGYKRGGVAGRWGLEGGGGACGGGGSVPKIIIFQMK